ncbi:hypothetical protein [[Mycobacterium] wendilense]|uniref:Predicted hydrolase N-terminal domain-containing protein n=1 Tax=[Mycobacterium] wendilense TaxID=3064284 RepID=A0ABN9P2P3_9MYCO|nr:hypothetical protein [Mycolicibacterium sp. MU0050]CAJ1585708.1 hypothetical protein MU0050_003867 [Mycolicibacterium sp. MU0050]
MLTYPSLTHIDIDALIAEAGGDPWQIYATLEAGDPGQISELARAFYEAGACAEETKNEFDAATERFLRSWNRENGEHPINDSAEVHRAQTQLWVQVEQLPNIGIDLQNIAADLAETQRMGSFTIDNLDKDLVQLDGLIGAALDADMDTSGLEDRAVDKTIASLGAMQIFRDTYAAKLQAALTDLRLKHGYDPAAIDDVDGDGIPGDEQRGQSATEHYDANQRAADEALVNAPGEMTQDKADATARLRDFATVNDPNATPDARRLAGERLDDFRMANFDARLPVDPVLGGDARTRAQKRLDMQRQLESGRVHLGDGIYHDVGALTPDQATETLNNGEQTARVIATKKAYIALIGAGMSEDGAKQVITDLANNTGRAGTVAQHYGDAVPQGKHALATGLSPDDAKVLAKYAGKLVKVTDAIQLGVAYQDWRNGGSNEDFGRSVGTVAGGAAGSYGAALVAGSFLGPVGTAAVGLGGLIVLGAVGGELGEGIGGAFDPKPTAAGGGSW